MVAICRLCASLKKSETLTFIRDNNHDICTKLLKCCQLEIDLNNVLPRGVCPECIRNLNASFEFYGRVHESQQSLEKLLNVQQKFKNETEYITTCEEEKLFEERKSFDLITTATGSNLEKPTIGKEIPIANSDNIDPLSPSEWSNEVDDEDVSFDDNHEVIREHPSQQAVCSEKEEVVEIKMKRANRKTFEIIISGEKVNDAQTGEPIIPGDSDLETAVGYVEDEVGEVFDGEYEIIEVIENNESKHKEDNSVDVIEPLRNSPDFESEYLSGCQEADASSSVSVLDRMNSSTWSDYIWKCIHCSEIFCTAHELAKHYEDVEEKVSSWVCVDCLKVFPRYYSLINHIRQRHRQHLGLLCDICNKNCKSFAELDRHRQCLHNDVLFKMLICSKCGKGFNSTNSLQIHSKCHLPDDMRLKFSCNLCDKSFRSSSNLKFHQKMHAGMKDFVCDHCGKKFIQRANLEEHLVTHIEFTPYECDLCNKLFKTSERLSKHKTRHTDDKPFRCNWTGCDKTFRTKDAMNSHTRIHTGEMPFQCEFCQKPFRFRSTLVTHHNIHTGIRPYSCDDCNHQFTNWPNYNKHMKRRHGIDVSSKNPRGKKPSQPRIKNINEKKQDIAKKTKAMEDKVSIDEKVYYQNVFEEEERDEDEELKIIELEDFNAEYEPEEDINIRYTESKEKQIQ